MGFKIKFKFRSGAGSSEDGGRGHASSPRSPTSPRIPQHPLVPPRTASGGTDLPSSSGFPQPSLPWRPPANEVPRRSSTFQDKGGEQDVEDIEEDDWDDLEEEKEEDEELIKLSQSPCLFMSRQKDTPQYMARCDWVPLDKHIYFSLHKQWRQLLSDKRTYLRPRRDRHVLDDVFRCPDPLPRTLGCKEPLSALIESAENPFIQQKIKLLSEQYTFVRQTRRDGSSFYRGFLFSYMENLVQMRDSRAEISRLRGCLEMSLKKFCILRWDCAYFLNPKAYMKSVVLEFIGFVRSVANGTADLYKRSVEEIMSTRILSFLRLLTEIEIRTRGYEYKPFFSRHKHSLEFCLDMVRPMDVEADQIQIRALSHALGIPLRIEVADSRWQSGVLLVERQYFFPGAVMNTNSAPLHSSSSSPSTTANTREQRRDGVPMERAGASTIGNLVSPDGIPLVTLVSRPGHYDILYLK